MSKVIKNHIMNELTRELDGHGEVLVVDVSGLTGNQVNDLRLALGEQDISLLTVKNSLARRACESIGLGAVGPILEGPSTLVWGGEDVVALSREITKWAKEIGSLAVKGGTVEGKTLDAVGVDKLSKSPGRLELLSIISGLILSPGGNIAGALLGPGGRVAGQIKSKAEEE
ncbi:MAG: 50S ribosomal protein L10 [Planctomycetota bacterium]|nr:50S ribosomal protein L10 [Planctomycetota bacterium]MDA1251177.1 50S ribosomal protein L10 [Planctomycetota bacterium]